MNNGIGVKYLIKITPKIEYGRSAIQGKLFMRPARYYTSLEQKGQGDRREGQLVSGQGITKGLDHYIYCMYSVKDSEIIDDKILIDKRTIQDFCCEEGCLAVIKYDGFIKQFKDKYQDNFVSHGMVSYTKLGPQSFASLANDVYCRNLLIKDPLFSHQHEYRFIMSDTSKATEGESLSNDSKIYEVGDLSNNAVIVPINKLEIQNDYYVLHEKDLHA